MVHTTDSTAEKLRLIRSPVVSETVAISQRESFTKADQNPADIESLGYRHESQHDCPSFEKHDDATNLELFYDLFFAANLTVFSETQQVTDIDKFSTYVGYFCMLWFTWMVTGLYDVRFVTDSIFERCARAVHLGVMVGFSVVAPNFDPTKQDPRVFRTMSLILTVSRLCLAVEYGSIIFHVRKYNNSKLPLFLLVVQNFVAAMIYLGIAFRFTEGNSRVFYAWYIVGVGEVVVNVAISGFYRVLSFRGTHLIRRMSLLTLIILGEGIIVVCQNITVVVKNPDAWTSSTIGVVTAAVATIYVVFMVYFDWMRHLHLPPIRQQAWAFLHFPIHLAMVLFMEGSTQFVVWWKILETEDIFFKSIWGYLRSLVSSTETTEQIVDTLTKILDDFFTLYPPTYTSSTTAVTQALANLTEIPNIPELLAGLFDQSTNTSDPDFSTFANSIITLISTADNVLLQRFKIDLTEDIPDLNEDDLTNMELGINEASWNRFNLVFQYAFVGAGIFLILANVLYCISRTEPWHRWNIIRAIINFLLGIGLALVALVANNDSASQAFEYSPWLLPLMCLTYFVVLVLNHLPNSPPLFFKRSKEENDSKPAGPAADQTVTLTPGIAS